MLINKFIINNSPFLKTKSNYKYCIANMLINFLDHLKLASNNVIIINAFLLYSVLTLRNNDE